MENCGDSLRSLENSSPAPFPWGTEFPTLLPAHTVLHSPLEPLAAFPLKGIGHGHEKIGNHRDFHRI